MALNSLFCADVLLNNYSLPQLQRTPFSYVFDVQNINNAVCPLQNTEVLTFNTQPYTEYQYDVISV